MSNVQLRQFAVRILFLGAAALACSAALAEQVNQPIREEVLSLAVSVDVRALTYSHSNADATVYGREAVPIRVSIGNSTSADVSIGSAFRHWSEALLFSVEATETTESIDSDRAPVIARLGIAPAARGPIEMKPSRHVEERFSFQSRSSALLPTGRYRLSVTMDDGALSASARRFRNVLKRVVVIDVKDAHTREELADQYLQLADALNRAGRFAESRAWDEKVLALIPNSVVALTDIGVSYLKEANCESGIPVLERVIVLLNTYADRLVEISESDQRGIANGLRGRIKRECGR